MDINSILPMLMNNGNNGGDNNNMQTILNMMGKNGSGGNNGGDNNNMQNVLNMMKGNGANPSTANGNNGGDSNNMLNMLNMLKGSGGAGAGGGMDMNLISSLLSNMKKPEKQTPVGLKPIVSIANTAILGVLIKFFT